jgi:hypothetical protein
MRKRHSEETPAGESLAARALRDGPLPGIHDDSELVGEENEPHEQNRHDDRTRDGVTIPSRGVGAMPAADGAPREDPGEHDREW